MKNELNFPPNFEGLVLGCIDADFKIRLVMQLSIEYGGIQTFKEAAATLAQERCVCVCVT